MGLWLTTVKHSGCDKLTTTPAVVGWRRRRCSDRVTVAKRESLAQGHGLRRPLSAALLNDTDCQSGRRAGQNLSTSQQRFDFLSAFALCSRLWNGGRSRTIEMAATCPTVELFLCSEGLGCSSRMRSRVGQFNFVPSSPSTPGKPVRSGLSRRRKCATLRSPGV